MVFFFFFFLTLVFLTTTLKVRYYYVLFKDFGLTLNIVQLVGDKAKVGSHSYLIPKSIFLTCS